MIYSIRMVLICAATTVLSVAMNSLGIGKENTLMIFLVGVLAVTTLTGGYAYAAIASVLSVLLFNYFFTQPLYTLLINQAQDFMLIVFFLVASLISSTMTTKMKKQTEIAKQNERTARQIYEITEGFLNVTGKEDIVRHGMQYIYDQTGYHCRILLFQNEETFFSPGFPAERYDQTAEYYKLPIKGLASRIGTFEILTGETIPQEKKMLIKTVLYQMALMLDREFLYNGREEIRVAMESEHTKSMLLRSISHDLRTPLTGIMGASGLIIDSGDELDRATVKKLAVDIYEESSWLIHTVQNILDMTRISEGKLVLNKCHEAVDDLVNEALSHAPQLAASGRLTVMMPEEIILVLVDGKLMVQAFVNLFDNAFKYTSEQAQIQLQIKREGGAVVFKLSDDGEGIDPQILDKLFDGFVTRSKNVADGRRGAGLGLSICKAIITAHNGTLTVENQKAGGALFTITLPADEA